MLPLADDRQVAQSLLDVLGDSTWDAVGLARAFIAVRNGSSTTDVAAVIYKSTSFSRRELTRLLTDAETLGFTKVLPERTKLGSAENPITKLFPAAITEQRFKLVAEDFIATAKNSRKEFECVDDRAEHGYSDFTIREVATGLKLPINIKNAGTLFRNAASLVDLSPDDCIPIPAYKAFGALESGSAATLPLIRLTPTCTKWSACLLGAKVAIPTLSGR